MSRSVDVEIITAKYGDHLSFYRQQDEFAGSRLGAEPFDAAERSDRC